MKEIHKSPWLWGEPCFLLISPFVYEFSDDDHRVHRRKVALGAIHENALKKLAKKKNIGDETRRKGLPGGRGG